MIAGGDGGGDRASGRMGSAGASGARIGSPGIPAMPSTRAVYVISVAAELAGVHPQTLRIYERRGLVGPARTGGGSRRYSERDIARLRRILDLTAAGLNLEGVRRGADPSPVPPRPGPPEPIPRPVAWPPLIASYTSPVQDRDDET